MTDDTSTPAAADDNAEPAPAAVPPAAAAEPAPAVRRRNWSALRPRRAWLLPAGFLVAGLVIGAGGAAAFGDGFGDDHHGGRGGDSHHSQSEDRDRH